MKSTLLGERLKQLRKLNNLSQQAVANELDIIRQTYSHYETSRSMPSIEILYKLSKLYLVPLESLLLNNNELDNLINFVHDFDRQNKIDSLSFNDKKLLYYYEMLSDAEKEDILEFIKSRAFRKLSN